MFRSLREVTGAAGDAERCWCDCILSPPNACVEALSLNLTVFEIEGL